MTKIHKINKSVLELGYIWINIDILSSFVGSTVFYLCLFWSQLYFFKIHFLSTVYHSVIEKVFFFSFVLCITLSLLMKKKIGFA